MTMMKMTTMTTKRWVRSSFLLVLNVGNVLSSWINAAMFRTFHDFVVMVMIVIECYLHFQEITSINCHDISP